MAAIGSIFAFWNINVSKKSIELQRKQWEHSLIPIYRISYIQEFSRQDTSFVLENTNHVAHQIENISFTVNEIEVAFSFHGSIESKNTRGTVIVRESEHSGFIVTLNTKSDKYICGHLQIIGKDSLGNGYTLNTNLIEFENYKLKNHLNLSKSYLNNI